MTKLQHRVSILNDLLRLDPPVPEADIVEEVMALVKVVCDTYPDEVRKARMFTKGSVTQNER